MSVPAVRSFMMIALVMLAVLLDRTALSLRTIAWAALVLLAFYPDSIFGASFQMSFIAVLALIALYEQAWLRSGWRNAEGELSLARIVGVYVAGLVVTDIVAGGATSLFAAYHFNRLPTYSAFTNLVAVPLTGLWIMPAGIAGLLLMPLGWEAVPFKVMGAGVATLNDVARRVAGWPHAQFHVAPFTTGAMALAALGVVWICIWRGPRRWAGAALLAPALLQMFFARTPDVIVDDTARVFAVGGADGRIALRPGRSGRFVRQAWIERYGSSATPWRDVAGLSCDAGGCVLERAGRRLLLAFAAEAVAEDCVGSDLTISAAAARDLCRSRRVIDIIDLARDGALAVWIDRGGLRTRSVREATGNRVWMRGVAGGDADEEDEIEP